MKIEITKGYISTKYIIIYPRWHFNTVHGVLLGFEFVSKPHNIISSPKSPEIFNKFHINIGMLILSIHVIVNYKFKKYKNSDLYVHPHPNVKKTWLLW